MGFKEDFTRLNTNQKSAVKCNYKRLLILAGAGSGKTTTISLKVVKHIHTDKINPSDILGLTFTNKSGRELKDRVQSYLKGSDVEGMFMGTFHSFCARLLRRYHIDAHLPENFQIIDTDDAISLLRRIITESLDDEIQNKNLKKHKLKQFKQAAKIAIGALSYIKNLNKNNKDLLILLKKRLMIGTNQEILSEKDIPLLFKYLNIYEKRKARNNILDFDDLLIRVNKLTLNNANIRTSLQKQYKAIIVDEFQDVNYHQLLLIKLLLTGSNYITVVGDDDQSIYSWRGADIRHILGFNKTFNSKTITLVDNYRSSQHILDLANGVIQENQYRKEKKLRTNSNQGGPVTIKGYRWAGDEAKEVALNIKNELVTGNATPCDIAVLYRNNSLSRMMQIELSKLNIQYSITGGTGIFESKVAKDMLALLRWIDNSKNETAILRSLTSLKIGVGNSKIQKISDIYLSSETESFEESISLYITKEPAGTKKLEKTLNTIKSTRDEIKKENVYESLQKGLSKLMLLDKRPSESDDEFNERILVIQAILDISSCHTSLTSLLEETSLDKKEQSLGKDSVTLSTIHSAKGLEYKSVYIIGAENDVFKINPHDSLKNEEERRLLYVAITRAKVNLGISFSNHRNGKSTMGLSVLLSSSIHEDITYQ